MAEKIDWSSMEDTAFVEKAEQQIWFSAFASNNPRAPAHSEVDKAYDEAKRRGKPWLYQKAYNKAYRSCGFQPSEYEISREKPEAWDAKATGSVLDAGNAA